MLHLAYLGEDKELNLNKDTIKLLIVRRPPSVIPKGFTHVPQLSPSQELFNRAQRWKRLEFTSMEEEFLSQYGLDGTEEKVWWPLYVRDFNKELVSRPDMVKAINRLEQLIKEGKEIYLFCFCKNVYYCHRGLIGEYFKDKGYTIDFRPKIKKNEEEKDIIQLDFFE